MLTEGSTKRWDSREYPELKVKIKSLTAESRIIRAEERRCTKGGRQSLANHRRGIVRSEARSSQLAYGFLRKKPYRSMEAKCHTKPVWGNVERVARKFGSGFFSEAGFAVWKKEGVEGD